MSHTYVKLALQLFKMVILLFTIQIVKNIEFLKSGG